VRRAGTLLVLALAVAGCSHLGLDAAGRWCEWAGVPLAFQGHTTLAAAGLQSGPEASADQPGDLVVTAEPVPIPQAAPDFSAPPTSPPEARMYCFHPEGSNIAIRGVLPDGWQPPRDG
jgi:hypothetical protein